jgi:hypothetical protein
MNSVDTWNTFVLYYLLACWDIFRYFINHRLSCKTVWKLEPFPQSVPAQQHQAAAQAQVADSVLSVLLKVGGSAMFRDQIGSVCVGFGFGWIPRKLMVQWCKTEKAWLPGSVARFNPDTMQVADEAGLELERQEILAAQVPNAAIAMAVFDVFFVLTKHICQYIAIYEKYMSYISASSTADGLNSL